MHSNRPKGFKPAGIRPALTALVCVLAVLAPAQTRAEDVDKTAPATSEAQTAPQAPSKGLEKVLESVLGQPAEEKPQQEEKLQDESQETLAPPTTDGTPESAAAAPDEALAQTEPAAAPTEPPAQEFLGFAPLNDERSLGNDVFRSSTRSVLTELFKSLTARDANPAMHKLTNRALLTAGRQSDIISDAKPAPGEDLLTIRLEKMLERGLYAEAASIYTSLEAEPYHERLASAGLTALIVTGRKSLACLDIKTFFGGNGQTPAWKELGAYCNHVMQVAAGVEAATAEPKNLDQYTPYPVLKKIAETPEYTESYNPAPFDKLTQFERAVLIGENRLTIDLSLLRQDLAADRIPPSHIQALLQLPSLDLETRMLLIVTGIRSASVSHDTLYGLFKTAQIGAADTGPTASLIQIYRRIKAKEPDNDIPVMMRSALRLAANIGPEAMIPLISTLETVEPGLLDPLDYSAALAAFTAADRDLTAPWKESLTRREIPASLSPPSLRETLIVQTYALTEPHSRSPQQKQALRDLLTARQQDRLLPLIGIIENVDKGDPAHNNGPKVYENGFDSSPDKGYTMATAQPQERLKQAVSANAIGETVLLSNLVFRRASAEPYSPDALIEVAGSLKTIGLYDQAQTMVSEAVFAAIK